MRRREKGREEIRDTNKDIGSEGYHGGCAEWTKRNRISLECHHTFPISVSESAVSISCCLSFGVIKFNLCVTSLLRDVVVSLEGRCLSMSGTKETLCYVNFAVPWPCVSGWRRRSQQSLKHKKGETAKGRSTASHHSSPSLTRPSSLASHGACICAWVDGQRVRFKDCCLLIIN